MKILITGGTGFIGRCLTSYFKKRGDDVLILTRNINKAPKHVKAIDNLSKVDVNEKIEVIINLAGAPINKRWTKSYKQKLIESRVQVTDSVIDLIKRLENKPELLISASAIGYYGAQDADKILNESSVHVDGFTHKLCALWESKAQQAKMLGVRTCIARLGVVLDNGGGALKQMVPPFKVGLGGKIGSGKQVFSWVHRDDVTRAFDFFIQNKKLSGVYNLTAPMPVSNQDFTVALGKALNRPALLPLPGFIIKILFGEMGDELLLKGQKVIPKKLLDTGFRFEHNDIQNTLNYIFKRQ